MTYDEAVEMAGRVRYGQIGGSVQEVRDELARNGLAHLDAKSVLAEFNRRREAREGKVQDAAGR